MPSEAQKSLDANLMEIDRLLELHTLVGGPAKGRRRGLEVLNKSAIVLITAYWEAYCEDIAAEALAHIVKHAKSSAVLPNELKKQLPKN
jgi:RiboL-PSP-HEPN